MALQGYADDSGTSEGNRDGDILILAGYVAAAENWARLSEAWEAECRKSPATSDFKMAKAMRPIGSEEGYEWSDRQREERIAELVRIVNRWTELRVSCALMKSGYREFVQGKVAPGIDSPYFLAFYTLMFAAADHMAKRGMEGAVDWVFEEQGKLGRRTSRYYDYIRENAGPVCGPRMGARPVFRHDSALIPLKAADMLAWSLRRYHAVEQPAGQNASPALEQLLSEKYGVMSKLDGGNLRMAADLLPRGTLPITASVRHYFPHPI